MSIEDVSVVSNIPLKIPTKAPFKISAAPKVVSVIITSPAPFPYSLDKAVPWNYETNVYVHEVKQDTLTKEAMNFTTPTVDNIVGTSKITRSGRIFSPEISPNVATNPVQIPDINARGKEPLVEPVQVPMEVTIEDPSRQEMEEI